MKLNRLGKALSLLVMVAVFVMCVTGCTTTTRRAGKPAAAAEA